MKYLLVLLTCTAAAFGLKDAAGPDGVNAGAVHELGITGRGVCIGLLSSGNVRAGHAAFARDGRSAVTNHDYTGSGLSRSSHDTQMAGIAVSGGSPAQPGHIGIAPGAALHSARISASGVQVAVFNKALHELITQHNCRIIMTGVQLPDNIVTPDGNSYWSKLYDYCAETYDVIFAVASGNSSPQVTVFGDIYNGITTAALVRDEQGAFEKTGSASNRGPAADGRRKPEIAAPVHGMLVPNGTGDDLWAAVDSGGSGLTSFAVPHTAGTAALLLEAAAKSGFENAGRSLVIKSVIVNSAAKQSGRWDSAAGYGRIDALTAHQTLTAGPLVKETPARQTGGWAYDQMPASGEHVYKIEIDKEARLRTTVTWHRKLHPAGTTFLEEPVRFFLNLKIIAPSGRTVEFEIPGRDNLIRLDTPLKESGTWQIVLSNPTQVGGRAYALAFQLL